MADAVGSSVLADVPEPAPAVRRGVVGALRDVRRPSVDAWAFRQLLRALVVSIGPGPVGSDTDEPRRAAGASALGHRHYPRRGPRGLAVAPARGVRRFAGDPDPLRCRNRSRPAASLWAACSPTGSELRPGLQLEARAASPVVTLARSARRSLYGPSRRCRPGADAFGRSGTPWTRSEGIPGSAPDADDEDDEKPAVNAMSRATPPPDVWPPSRPRPGTRQLT